MTPVRRSILAAAALLVGCASPTTPSSADPVESSCAPASRWAVPGAGVRATPVLTASLARRRVVLLGEGHDIPEHHRWQLQTIAALHGQRPDLVLGFEMFPRSAQPVLDRWVAGALSEAELLRGTDWKAAWGFDAGMYLPIFHFARMNRIPMVGLNIDAALVREIGAVGFDAVPAQRREGLSRPAPALPAYEEFLFETFSRHPSGPDGSRPARGDPRFQRFVESQLVWDRAMAERITGVFAARPGALVVALMGTGHLMNGWGVPHQLRALGERDAVVLLPWEPEEDCTKLVAGYADAVFGLGARSEDMAAPPKLGLWLEQVSGGIAIKDIVKGGLGDQAGLRQGDVLVEVAGRVPRQPGDVSDAVQRQAPGTWLPLKVQRDGRTLEIIAKFPAAAS
jgi:uncharacterized iron-regulated protein